MAELLITVDGKQIVEQTVSSCMIETSIDGTITLSAVFDASRFNHQ